jgi:hypothetical protein
MSIYKLFKTNAKLESEGVDIQYGRNSKKQPITIKLARAGGKNSAYNKMLEFKTKPHRRAIQTGTIDLETANGIFHEVYAETVVKGWENMEDENGKPLPYSKENVIKLFVDLPDFFAEMKEMATGFALWREQELEDDLGNSGQSSVTPLSKEE